MPEHFGIRITDADKYKLVGELDGQRPAMHMAAVVQMVPGRLTGVAVPVHVGRRTIVLQTSIYRPDGKLAAMMIQTQMVLPSGAAASSNQGSGEA